MTAVNRLYIPSRRRSRWQMQRQQGGFTLLEILAAVFIFVLVIGCIWSTFHSTLAAFEAGEKTMDTYQDARVTMQNFTRDLRRAVSPNSRWSNDQKAILNTIAQEEQRQMQEGIFDLANDPFANDPSLNRDIRFVGTSNEVTLTLSEQLKDPKFPYDLCQVRYFADKEREQLVKSTVQSIVALRREEWRADRILNETDYREVHDMTASSFEVQKEQVIGNSIKELTLRYFDGAEWRDEWDSDQPIEPEEDEYEEETEEEIEEHWESYNYIESEKVGL
ncbi:MAG TPA: prepilin-type N-terminal cleavage/methylation domain-containing protein, partial [bacterium]|nr:prepilin-type N-terminal cleavage/methylation domain-containing protein [bacterium]